MNQEIFQALADAVCQTQRPSHRVTLNLSAESSDFIRLNRARVRQATTVNQQTVSVSVIDGQRRASCSVSLPGDLAQAQATLTAERDNLLAMLPFVPEDPHLVLPDSVQNSSREDDANGLADTSEVIDQLIDFAGEEDLVGFYAAGPMVRAFADSQGQRNWHHVASFHLDWSLFTRSGQAKDRAVKSIYAGRTFEADVLRQKMNNAKTQLTWLEKPIKKLAPGKYRAWLAPAAVADLLLAMAWSGFSRKERASGTSSLIRLTDTDARLSPLVSLTEATSHGIAPAFTDTGQLRPDQVMLVTAGALSNTLTSQRSGAEFDEPANASGSEYPEAMELAGGMVADEQALTALGTGLWIGNVWYLNYSDRQAARVTGMTRFACFWVEDGKIQAPVDVMRFDDTLIRLFGTALEALGQTVEFIPGSSTWGERELNSVSCPGLLLSDLKLTL